MDDAPEALTPTRLSKAVKISVPYAWQIMNNKRVPPLAMALRIWKETGHRFGPLADATEDEIAVLERFQGAA